MQGPRVSGCGWLERLHRDLGVKTRSKQRRIVLRLESGCPDVFFHGRTFLSHSPQTVSCALWE